MFPMLPRPANGAARRSRRQVLRSIGGLGVASVLWTIGCAPVLVAPGVPIVEHHNPPYWIGHYGDPPDGAIGLEATVDVQPVDFRFQNTTPDWLKLTCTPQNGALTLTIHGVKPGWTVAITPPVVTN